MDKGTVETVGVSQGTKMKNNNIAESQKAKANKRPKLYVDVSVAEKLTRSPQPVQPAPTLPVTEEAPVSPLSPGRGRLRRSMKGKGRRKWAKAEVGIVNHKFPLMDLLRCPASTTDPSNSCRTTTVPDEGGHPKPPFKNVTLLKRAVAEGWTLEGEIQCQGAQRILDEEPKRPLSGAFSNVGVPQPSEPNMDRRSGPKSRHSQPETRDWFQLGMSREDAADRLQKQPTGSFIIRKSTSRPHCYALALKSPDTNNKLRSLVTHYLVRTDSRNRIFLNGSRHKSSSLDELVNHLSQTSDLLPCTLQF